VGKSVALYLCQRDRRDELNVALVGAGGQHAVRGRGREQGPHLCQKVGKRWPTCARGTEGMNSTVALVDAGGPARGRA